MIRNNKRIVGLIILVVGASLITGWGEKKVVGLLTENPLIDLSAAIHDAPFGNQGNENNSDYEENDESILDSDNPVSGPNQQIQPEDTTKTITITIDLKSIEYQEEGIEFDSLRDRIVNDYSAGDNVVLYDHFAEAHVYKNVRGLLDELRDSMGLIYSETSW